MKMPDVNVWIYAHRREDPSHAFYRSWIEDLLNATSPFGLSALVASAFVRIVTHPRFSPEPTPLFEALETIDHIRRCPGCRWLLPGDRHWEIISDLCRRTGVTGKSVADAQHAAIAIENGCQWVTRDLDFAKFEPLGLEWVHLEPPC